MDMDDMEKKAFRYLQDGLDTHGDARPMTAIFSSHKPMKVYLMDPDNRLFYAAQKEMAKEDIRALRASRQFVGAQIVSTAWMAKATSEEQGEAMLRGEVRAADQPNRVEVALVYSYLGDRRKFTMKEIDRSGLKPVMKDFKMDDGDQMHNWRCWLDEAFEAQA